MVEGAYNPSYLGDWDRRMAWTQEAEVAAKIMPLHSSLGGKSEISFPPPKKEEELNNIIQKFHNEITSISNQIN